ncbi:MAG TPA: hypothetical protein VFV08_12415, partial [Puia sp.]|nr:hypothetical protein [Puia sp.]
MRFATRMLLIPEDVYMKLTASGVSSETPATAAVASHSREKQLVNVASPTALSNSITGATDAMARSSVPEDHAIALQRNELSRIAAAPNADEYAKHLRYMQEYRRMRKLEDDRDERPVRVQIVGRNQQMPFNLVKKRNPLGGLNSPGNNISFATRISSRLN